MTTKSKAPASTSSEPPASTSSDASTSTEPGGVRVSPQVRGDHTGTAEDVDPAPSAPTPTGPEPVEVRQTTITTLGEVQNETRPGFDAGGTPVIPNSPPRSRIAEIGDYPRTYEEAVLLQRYRDGEVDELGREVEDDDADQSTRRSTRD